MKLSTSTRLTLAGRRMRRAQAAILTAAGHEADQGNLAAAIFFIALYLCGLAT